MYPGQMRTGKSKRMQQPSRGLLFIGGPSDALPGIARAKALGYRVFVTDRSPDAPAIKWAKQYADGWGVADIYDFAETIKVAKEWEFDGCLSIGCDIGPCVSLVSKYFRLPHVPYGISRLSWNKVELKQVLSKAGVSVPRTADFVVKPPDSRGSRGVSIVSASNLWGVEWETAKRESPTGRVMCEEYIQGPGISAEAIVWDSSIVFVGCTDRIYSISLTVEEGGRGPSQFDGPWLKELTSRVVQAIKLKSGSLKLDIILRDGDITQPVILESALGRLGGGRNGDMFLSLSYNVDFLAMAFAVYCGQDPYPLLDKKLLKSKLAQNGYHVASRYTMNGQPTSNKERGQVFFGLGKTKNEAERKVSCWLKRRNSV